MTCERLQRLKKSVCLCWLRPNPTSSLLEDVHSRWVIGLVNVLCAWCQGASELADVDQ